MSTPLILIIVLAVAGVLFMGAEIVLPGGILGIFGSLCFLAVVVLVFLHAGFLWALAALAGSFALALITFYFEIKVLEKTKLGRESILSASLKGAATGPLAAHDIVGKCGEVATPMNPTGMVNIENALYEAASIDGSLQRGDRVVVAGQDNFRLLVKKIETPV